MKQATILVVDDEAFFRQLYTEILSGAGYAVEAVDSGEEALGRLGLGGVDVVITDMVMPGISGLDLLKESRRVDNPPEVILVTGHATVETAIQALKAGARDYLVKPFNPEALLHLLHTCLEQRRLLDENIHLKNQIRLFQSGQYLAAILETGRLIPQTITTLVRESGQGRGFAFLLRAEGDPGVLGLHGLEEEQAQSLARALLPLTSDLEALRTLSPEEFEASKGLPPGLRRVYLYPLRSQGELQGGLVYFNPPEGDFPTPPFEQNLRYLFEQASLGFENAFRYEGARDLMYSDDLTGLHNYRYLHAALDQEIRRGERYGYNFSVIFIDLDHFKEINDTYGHLVGSNTLREVAVLLRRCVREVDLLFRYGGDEFTALLVETDSDGAQLVAERIRRTIEEHLFTYSDDISFRLTATIGHATFPEDARDKERLVDMADQAMYRGKVKRNVVLGASEPKAS